MLVPVPISAGSMPADSLSSEQQRRAFSLNTRRSLGVPHLTSSGHFTAFRSVLVARRTRGRPVGTILAFPEMDNTAETALFTKRAVLPLIENSEDGE